ncbi:MAG: hypothetical protein CHACPFDD_03909 [Phycisphaerae bacterium]|nr:hypothetical protein [Phycisphaerae bacterium]
MFKNSLCVVRAALVGLCVFGFALWVPAVRAIAPSAGSGVDRVPEGLSASDCAGIRAACEAGRHAVVPSVDGYQARNPGQQWRTRFDGRGFVVTPDGGGWVWGLELVGLGHTGEACARFDEPTCIDVEGRRVAYEWSDGLTEWYFNDTRGLEHGYTIESRPVAGNDSRENSRERRFSHRRPVGSARASSALRAAEENRRVPEAEASGYDRAPSGRLEVRLAVRGGLRPHVSGDGRGVTFVDDNGAAVVNYNGLTVIDADGKSLPAWFEGDGQAALTNGRDAQSTHANGRDARTTQDVESAQLLRIVVDDADAVYPLTVDPIAQQAYLKASNTEAYDMFGAWVAISGDTAVVGAPNEDSGATGVNGDPTDNSAPDSGAAYVFVRSGTAWSQQAYLKASNTGAGDWFGGSVAISGDTIVVGASREDSSATGVNGNQLDDSAPDSGAAYVFRRSNGEWSQEAYLKASNAEGGDNFGSVSVSGDTIVVGAYSEDSSATGVNGDQNDNGASDSGAAYVFVCDASGEWTQQAYLKASNAEASDAFGARAAVSGDTIVVGAVGEDSKATGVNGNQADDSAADSGAAYVFVRDGSGEWRQEAYLKGSVFGFYVYFGRAVGVFGNTVVVGVPGQRAGCGAAYVFFRDGSTWSQQALLEASNGESLDWFGISVAVWGDTVVVGAVHEDSAATGVNKGEGNNSAPSAGAAYVFVRIGTTWSQRAYLKASNTDWYDYFGTSVALSLDTVVVGAYGEDGNATGVNGNGLNDSAESAGAAYVFRGAGPPPCDTNCDGWIDSFDIDPFVGLLTRGEAPCSITAGDVNGDGSVNGFDVDGFVAALLGGGC